MNDTEPEEPENLEELEPSYDDLILEYESQLEETEEKSLDATDLYLGEIGRAPLLSKEEEVYYAKLVQKGDKEAQKVMIESNLRLVVKIARKYIRSGIPLLDLIEEGNLGLMRAIEKFDPDRGFRFSTYGAWWIQQTIERAIMSNSRTIRLPVHIVKQLNACLRVSRELSKKLDHEPTVEEITEKLNRPEIDVEKIMALNEKTISIDSPISEEINKPLVETLGNKQYSPEKEFFLDNLKENINTWLDNLTGLQKSVIEYRFGLNNHEITTLEKTGEQIGITRERVRQLQAESINILKDLLKSQNEDLNSLLD